MDNRKVKVSLFLGKHTTDSQSAMIYVKDGCNVGDVVGYLIRNNPTIYGNNSYPIIKTEQGYTANLF